jgi:flagellar biosynthetic protein FliR
MPQANLMFIALPVKMGVGVSVFILILPYLPTAFDVIFQNLFFFLEGLLGNIVPVVT